MGSSVIGKIKYLDIPNWTEHTLKKIDQLSYVRKIYHFIEEAFQSYNSCLVVSVHNKCSTVVVAMMYLMIKYKWKLMRTIEYMNARKKNFEITKTIIKDLKKLEI